VLDSILPEFFRDGSQTSPTTGETFDFSIDAHDNIGIVKISVEYSFGGKAPNVIQMGGNGPYTCPITIPTNAAGTMQYDFIAQDAAGNENRTSVIILEVKDNDPPVISGDDTPGQANSGPVSFSINVTDNMAVQSVTANLWSEAGKEISFSLAPQADRWTGTYVFLADGTYYYRFIALDPSTNMAETSVSALRIGAAIPETPDITPPSIVISYPAMRAELPTGTNELAVRWSASDNQSGLAGCGLQLDSGPIIDAGMDMHYLIFGLQNGTHILKVLARDKAGNMGTAEAVFTIGEGFSDSTPPQIKITRPTNNQVRNDKKMTAAWTGSDGGSGILGYFVKLDDGPWIFVGPATSRILNLTTNGKHSLTVRALDRQGNSAEDTVSFKLEPKPVQTTNILMIGSALAMIMVVLTIVAAMYLRRRKSNSHQ
jgi:hypothetical protein